MPTSAIIRLAIRALNHPAARSLAKKILKNLKSGSSSGIKKQASRLKKLMTRTTRAAERATTETISPNPNVNLRRQLFYNPYEQKAGRGYFADFKKTPMIDVDLPGPHPDASIIWSSKGEALKNLRKYLNTAVGKKSLFKVYDTPGGLRLVDLSRRRSPSQYYNPIKESGWLQHKLGGDPWYPPFNVKRGAFGARLGPKPGREGDYVAKFVDYMGAGEANPKNVLDVKLYHDDLIRRIIKKSTKDEASLGGWFELLGKAAYTK